MEQTELVNNALSAFYDCHNSPAPSAAGGEEGLAGRGLCEHEGFCLDALLHFEHGWHPNCSGATPLCTDHGASKNEVQEEAAAAWMDDLVLGRDSIVAPSKECKLCSKVKSYLQGQKDDILYLRDLRGNRFFFASHISKQ